jgi:predicted acyl esterase
VLSPQDADDFYDVIEWAGAQPWSNGSVGTIGVSYLAISQWAAAGLNPPSLKAMVPWEGQTDSFREVLYHGGVPETTFTKFWLNRVNGLANTPPLPDHDFFQLIHRDPQAMTGIREQQFIRPELSEVPALVAATWSDQGLHTRGSFGGFAKSSATPEVALHPRSAQVVHVLQRRGHRVPAGVLRLLPEGRGQRHGPPTGGTPRGA